MRVPSPTSRGGLRFSFRPLDVALALVSPLLALYLTDAYVLAEQGGWTGVGIYGFVSILFSCIAFVVFRTEEGILRHFSVDDTLGLAKAVASTVVLTCVICFALTRLESIPRSAPILHGLILWSGLVLVRVYASIVSKAAPELGSWESTPENVILVTSSSLTPLYIRLLSADGSARRQVVSLLDSRPEMTGRAVDGVPIVGTPQQLGAVIEEYRVHGLEISRVIFADANADQTTRNVKLICGRERIRLDFLPQLLPLTDLEAKPQTIQTTAPGIAVSPYFRWKHVVDMTLAAVLIVVLFPLIVGTALVVLVDVGSPVLFWQRRLGARGRWFLLYKFRTLNPPLNRFGELVPAEARLSRIGRLLRDTSLDELPQLFSVLIGDMAMIGPRPLLPVDQPKNASVRLMVPPGITGWAQVNGRKSLTPEAKEQLDAWYIRNASLGVDARIVIKTMRLLLGGITSSKREFSEDFRASLRDDWQEGKQTQT